MTDYRYKLASNKKVNWGYINMEDYLIHQDEKRREAFKARFKSWFDGDE